MAHKMERNWEKEEKDTEWDKWCEKREMDDTVHKNVIVKEINDINVYKDIITILKPPALKLN